MFGGTVHCSFFAIHDYPQGFASPPSIDVGLNSIQRDVFVYVLSHSWVTLQTFKAQLWVTFTFSPNTKLFGISNVFFITHHGSKYRHIQPRFGENRS